MDKEEQLEIIKNIQEAVSQMREDDYEESPDWAEEVFTCECCGKDKEMAGSLIYESARLCNDCVLLMEVGLALEKVKNLDDLIKSMEDKKLEELCEYIKDEQKRINN